MTAIETSQEEYTRYIINGLSNGQVPTSYNPESAGIYAPIISLLMEDYDPDALDEFMSSLEALKNRHVDFKRALSGEEEDNFPLEPPDVEMKPGDLVKFDADDSGNGDAMFYLYGKKIRWCTERGWMIYTGTHWKLDKDGASVRRRTVECLRRRRHAAIDMGKEAIIKVARANKKTVDGCLHRLQSLVSIGIEAFDKDPDLLNCKNGVVDLRTGLLSPHQPKQRFTYCLPVEYKKSDVLEWVNFLQSVVGGGEKIIDWLQMALGYSFTGHTSEEILFYMFGPSRAGKGTFAETILSLIPEPLATMTDFNSFTAKREGDISNFDLAPLKPSRVIFASESNRNQSLNPAKIKSLTGGDSIRACYKHRDFFSFRPQFKIWLMSNFPVNGDPEDDALWGRLRVINFPNSFLGKEDKAKKRRLKEPASQESVLYWIVQGAMKWYALGDQGLNIPKEIELETRKHRSNLDYVQKWLDECSEDDPEAWTSNEDITKSYLAWCKDQGVLYPKGAKGLSQSLNTKKGYESGIIRKVEGITKRGVKGLRLLSMDFR